MRCLAVILALLAPLPAQAGCSFILCDETETADPSQAAERLAPYLGAPLPDGVMATNLLEGGFQDGFLLARLESTDKGIAHFLRQLGLTEADFWAENGYETAADVLNSAAAQPDWWDWRALKALRVARTSTAALPFLSVGIAAKPGVPDSHVIFLWGFET
jgi:hypothetical protein